MSPLPPEARMFPSSNNPFPLSKSRKASAERRKSAHSPEKVAQGSWARQGLLGAQTQEEEEPQRSFLCRKEASEAVVGEGASVSHIRTTRPYHFIPHSFGGGEQRNRLYLGNSETHITLNPALFLLIA